VRTEGPADRDPETYQLYVAGWSALTRPGPRTLETALDYFEQAVARDPDFSLARVCVAETYMLLGSHGVRPPHQAFAQARAAVDAALKSDPPVGRSACHAGPAHLGIRPRDRNVPKP
jgi:hypothetical protein